MIMHTVYKTTNSLNNRYYIGVHSTENPNDNYLGSGYLLKKAIAKYGRDKFEKQILHTCDTKQQAYNIERQLVQEALKRKDGSYNLAEGGSGHKGPNKASRSVVVYSKKLKRLKVFPTMVEAATFLCALPTTVKEACEYALVGKSSRVGNYYVCFKGSKPHKRDFSYLVKRNKLTLAKLNKGKKRPQHGLLISKLNQQRPAAQQKFKFSHVSGIKFEGTRTQLREAFPEHNISRSDLTALVHGR